MSNESRFLDAAVAGACLLAGMAILLPLLGDTPALFYGFVGAPVLLMITLGAGLWVRARLARRAGVGPRAGVAAGSSHRPGRLCSTPGDKPGPRAESPRPRLSAPGQRSSPRPIGTDRRPGAVW